MAELAGSLLLGVPEEPSPGRCHASELAPKSRENARGGCPQVSALQAAEPPGSFPTGTQGSCLLLGIADIDAAEAVCLAGTRSWKSRPRGTHLNPEETPLCPPVSLQRPLLTKLST